MLVDTSTILRTLHPQREVARSAIKALTAQGVELQIVAQNLIELWVVATRPIEQNGLGMMAVAAAEELGRIKSMFLLLPETPDIYPAWEALVIKHWVAGKPAHDARLVAAMQVHNLTSVLTFDRAGFSRYPGIEVVLPDEVTA
ncbi:MAG: PIN domain-containing protein [Bryobacteraceae bacterium]